MTLRDVVYCGHCYVITVQLNNNCLTYLVRYSDEERSAISLILFQVFSQMIHVGVELEFCAVMEVIEAAILELQRNHNKVANPGPKDDVAAIKVWHFAK